MSPYVNHASELTDISQQASIACSVNILLLILRRSTILTTVSPKSAEPVVEQNSIKHKCGELISYRKNLRVLAQKLRFYSITQFLLKYATSSQVPGIKKKQTKNLPCVVSVALFKTIFISNKSEDKYDTVCISKHNCLLSTYLFTFK